MKKCEYCGKEYKLNENLPEGLPEKIRERLKYIPSCDCLAKKYEAEENERIEKAEKERRQAIVKKYKDISILDTKLENSNFENADMSEKYMAFCKKYADRFIEKGFAPKGLLLYGGVGTGKTFASACIGNRLMEEGKTVLIMNLGLYLIKIKSEWDKAENEVLNYVKKCDLLIIDDLGVENITNFVLDKVFTLIDTRYRANKPLIITTNLKLKNDNFSIQERFGQRIADRIEEMCFPLQVVGESRRKNKNLDEFMEFIA